jgi:chromosomal replication initiator protein
MLLDVVDERRGSPREWAKNYKAARKRLMTGAPLVTWAFEKIKRPIAVEATVETKITIAWPITVTRIVDATAVVYGFSRVDLNSHRRTKNLCKARHLAMYLARELTPRSMPEIARIMGGRDHTTVMHGAQKIAKQVADPDHEVHSYIAEIRAMLEA